MKYFTNLIYVNIALFGHGSIGFITKIYRKEEDRKEVGWAAGWAVGCWKKLGLISFFFRLNLFVEGTVECFMLPIISLSLECGKPEKKTKIISTTISTALISIGYH